MNESIIPWRTASSVFCAGVNSEGWNLARIPESDLDVPRTFSAEITFSKPFNSAPLVHASLTGFDLDQRDSARISVVVSDVTAAGFVTSVTTWMETRVYGVEVSWLAIGS
ncbi:MAG TPA: H-type lectin domain-containing protein [Chthoniobacterales bacterium]